ncbi:DENN domain-containing protein 1A-like [Pollicipes pollicipes]|uniref:DENN domain-containing protein 1A-like n=1 Tax=Pollicipes pollicipes TaxID=41117 RepID=UPI001884F507|nr:DENN domain-containing protein 1A-like [Pollicipes pollicipes]
MLSRIRDNAQHVFDCFCEVVIPSNAEEKPWIIQKFPDSYQNEETLKMVPQFTFPCEFERSTVQHFSFVLTNVDSKWTFGFCRHAPQKQTALVLLSAFPWHDAFFKLLDCLSELTLSDDQGQLWTCLQALHGGAVPDRGGPVTVPLPTGKVFSATSNDHYSLPCIPQDRNLTEYFNAVDSNNMMVMFASMLYERRIVVTSRKLSRLSACVQAANAIIYPMSWQHIFIPVLPASLMDYLSAPMPFVIGASSAIMQRTKLADIGDAVILDADNNRIDTPFNDLETLPADVVSTLKRQLKNPANLPGDGVARSFLRALVQLIGGYRDALRFPQNCAKITFDKEAFVRSRPSHIQPFLEKMLHLQIFHQFITERLEMLNSGQGFSDEFELEACLYMDKSSSRLAQQYKEWTSNVRKEGGAFFKTVRSKTNPAIKTAVKNVKETGKTGKLKVRSAYKDIRSRLKDIQPAPAGVRLAAADEDGEPQPRSAPSSPTASRPRRGIQAAAATAAATHTAQPIKYRVIDPPAPGSSDGELFQLRPASDGPSLLDEVDEVLLGRGDEPVFETLPVLAALRPSASPPPVPPPRHRRRPAETKEADLIRLDSTEDDLFDPLKGARPALNGAPAPAPAAVHNPVYPYCEPGRLAGRGRPLSDSRQLIGISGRRDGPWAATPADGFQPPAPANGRQRHTIKPPTAGDESSVLEMCPPLETCNFPTR